MTLRKHCDSVKGVTRSDEPTENQHLYLQLPSASRGFSVFQLIAYLTDRNFIDLVHSYCSHRICFG